MFFSHTQRLHPVEEEWRSLVQRQLSHALFDVFGVLEAFPAGRVALFFEVSRGPGSRHFDQGVVMRAVQRGRTDARAELAYDAGAAWCAGLPWCEGALVEPAQAAALVPLLEAAGQRIDLSAMARSILSAPPDRLGVLFVGESWPFASFEWVPLERLRRLKEELATSRADILETMRGSDALN
jgi:hypothetical protein